LSQGRDTPARGATLLYFEFVRS